MGISTDGIIAFGWIFEDGFEFPWDFEPWDSDEESWWMDVNEYQPLYSPFTDDGNYAEGFSRGDSRISKEYDNQFKWKMDNPLPVEVLNYCSYEYPLYALVLPETIIRCSRGYPEKLPMTLKTPTPLQIEELNSFVQKYNIEVDSEPSYHLMSFFG